MSVSISDGGLEFVSTLNNDDFQSKSLQDLQLIRARLELTGDVSGLEKYNTAFKNTANAEIKLRENLAKIIADAKSQATDLTTQQITQRRNSIDAINAETEALRKQNVEFTNRPTTSATGIFETGSMEPSINTSGQAEATQSLEALQAELTAVQEAIQQLNVFNEQGTVSTDVYASAIATLTENETALKLAIQNYNVAAVEQKTVTQEANIVTEEQIGILENLDAVLTKLKAQKFSIVDPAALAKQNALIQETEAELTRANNAGKVGYDDFGNKVKDLGNNVEQTEAKASKFGAAISRVTDLGNIGARAVTQLSRQIIGLGVGFLSFYVGAKAIEALISYVQQLDYFSGRLDQAKQNLLALNEVMADADKAAGPQVGALKQLYDAATDTNNSLKNRLAAAEQLRDSYHTEFQGATDLAIINGKLKGSYDELTQSIISVAKAQAASSKIGALESQNLDDQFQIDKNNLIKYQQIQQAYANYAKNVAYQQKYGSSGQASLDPKNILGSSIAQSTSQANAANLKPTQNIAVRDKTIQYFEQFTKNVTANAQALKDANAFLGDQLQNFDTLISGSNDKTQLENIKKDLQIKLDALKPGDAQIEQIRAALQKVDDLIKNTYDVKPSGKEKIDPAIAQGQALLAQRTALLEKNDALNASYASKDKTRDEAAVDAVKARYQAELDAITAFNTKRQNFIDKYNKQHKNNGGAAYANSIGLTAIDPTSVQNGEAAAVAGLQGAQSVEKLKEQIDQQKAIYKEYEDYKLKAGTDAADELYGTQIGNFKSYVDYLKSLQPTVDQLNSPDPKVKATASKTQDLLTKETAEANTIELVQQQKHLQDLFLQTQDYEQQREIQVQKASDNIALLTKAGYLDQAGIVAAQLQSQLEIQDANQAQRIESTKEFAASLVNLTTQQALVQINIAKAQNDAELASGKISVATFEAVAKSINDATASLSSNKLANYIGTIGGSLSSLGSEISKSNGSLGSLVSSLGSVLTSIKSISDLSTNIEAHGGFLKSLTGDDVKDSISVLTTGLTGIVSIISSITNSAAARKKAAEDYYNSVIAFQTAYNVALDEQLRLQYQTAQGSIFYNNTGKELSDAVLAYDAASKQYLASLTALQKGQAIVGQHNAADSKSILTGAASGAATGAAITALGGPLTALGGAILGGIIGGLSGLFAGKKKVDTLAPLLATYPQLIEANGEFNEGLAKTLIANNQVDDATKKLLNNTISYYDEEKTALDQITSTLTDMVGQLGTNISNALVQAFESGTDAAVAFKNAVSDILSQIIQQDLFVAVFQNSLNDLQQKLTDDVFANDGNTQAEIVADITDFYKNAQGLVPVYVAGLQAAQTAGNAAGLNIFPPASTTSGTGATETGAIQQQVTEATADILSGTLKGIQLNTYNMNQTMLDQNLILQSHSLSFGQMVGIAQDNLNVAMKIQSNTLRAADTLDNNLPAMLNVLNAIQKNNSGKNLSEMLRAAGKMGY